MTLRKVGFFRELDHGDPNGASLHESITSTALSFEEQLISYLRTASVLAATPSVALDIVDPSRITDPPHLMTDGVWLWPLDLASYVERYHLTLPPDFIEHLRLQDWKPRELNVDDLSRIEHELFDT
jgi:hypothetical protein